MLTSQQEGHRLFVGSLQVIPLQAAFLVPLSEALVYTWGWPLEATLWIPTAPNA